MRTIRELREALGLTQGELAARAGVSRQTVGALEAGRHLPRVDAAIGLARALGVRAEDLFSPVAAPVDVRSGRPPIPGTLVRLGRVGDRTVTDPLDSAWAVADGAVENDAVTAFAPLAPGLVVAGCEPGLATLESLGRQTGVGALAVSCATATAIAALAAGRIHAAVVHTTDARLSELARPGDPLRYRLAGWQVGLAGPPDAAAALFDAALGGAATVIQREAAAAVQSTFRERVGAAVPGPRAGSHLEAVRLALTTGLPAVSIEPAARAFGASFRALEMHRTELWLDRAWVGDRAVNAALDLLLGGRLRRQLSRVGGYELDGYGSRVA